MKIFLICKSLPTRSTIAALFTCLDTFIKARGINWSRHVRISTDGAHAISGTVNGLGESYSTTCYVDTLRHSLQIALDAKKIPEDLKMTFNEVLSVVVHKGSCMNS